MDHVAYMKRSWRLVDKILAGEKTIESRWYQTRRAPWNRIRKGETIYFKEGPAPVSVKATVAHVLQFGDLTPAKIKNVLKQYGNSLGRDTKTIFNIVKNKRYCILVVLRGPVRVRPFDVDKTGHGARAAWICTPDVTHIARRG